MTARAVPSVAIPTSVRDPCGPGPHPRTHSEPRQPMIPPRIAYAMANGGSYNPAPCLRFE
jgi:hypothetical protein